MANDWLHTSTGDPRGFIVAQELKELWFHTGTSCNLSCPFCLEGSSPGDNRIHFITLDDVKNYLVEAKELGVKQISFTGGEPFVNPHFIEILAHCLEYFPCMVLTNATEPLMNQIQKVVQLKEKPFQVRFRVSIDYPNAEQHDKGRGKGNFTKSLKTIAILEQQGFEVSIARLQFQEENTQDVDQIYQKLFEKYQISQDTHIVKFPDFDTPNSSPEVPEITETCMTKYLTKEQKDAFMCNFSRMIAKTNGRLSIYACTLVDDDDQYATFGTLKESLETKIMLKHHRCFSCFAYGASCSEK
ncbi:MAG: radical SAM protein [Lentisphaeria bacterium]|nr:radical SAM protein [Lentisphaeria bacterium]